MAHRIIHRCGDRLVDADGHDRTMEWWQLMEHRALGYYVLVAGGAGTKRAVDNIVVAGPFVRMANAQAAAAEIERRVSSDEQTMPSD